MTIRLKIIVSCALLLLISMTLGLFCSYQQSQLSKVAQNIEGQLGDTAKVVYDNAFMGVNYARSAQLGWAKFLLTHQGDKISVSDDASKAELDKLAMDLGVTVERAMTDKARDTATTLRGKVVALQGMTSDVPAADIADIGKGLEKLAGRYAHDGSDYREHIDTVLSDADKRLSGLVATNNRIQAFAIALAVLLSVLCAVFLVRSVIPPLKKALAIANAIAEGNLENEIDAQGKSETSNLLRALASMQSSLWENSQQQKRQAEKTQVELQKKDAVEQAIKAFEERVSHLLQGVKRSAASMKKSATTMVSESDVTNAKIQGVVGLTGEASTNVSTVAAAAEEMSASVTEVAHQMVHSENIARDAKEKAHAADARVNQLTESATKIGEIVVLIENIAGQINLLALNATIEAARAGEAGKGFSVVATEVKSLANRTAKATEAISEQVADIQGNVRATVQSLSEIGATIDTIGESSTAVSAAAQEQGSATQEIVQNIQYASGRVGTIAQDLIEVGKMSVTANENAAFVLESVESFSAQSDTLNAEIDGFLRKIRDGQ